MIRDVLLNGHLVIPKHRHSDRSLPLFGMEVFPHRKIDTVIPMVTRCHSETPLFRKITLRSGDVSLFFLRPCHSEYRQFQSYVLCVCVLLNCGHQRQPHFSLPHISHVSCTWMESISAASVPLVHNARAHVCTRTSPPPTH